MNVNDMISIVLIYNNIEKYIFKDWLYIKIISSINIIFVRIILPV